MWEFTKHFFIIICLHVKETVSLPTRALNDWMRRCGWVSERVCVCVCPQLVTISANHVGNVKAGNSLKGKLQYRIKPCNESCVWWVFVSARVPPGCSRGRASKLSILHASGILQKFSFNLICRHFCAHVCMSKADSNTYNLKVSTEKWEM